MLAFLEQESCYENPPKKALRKKSHGVKIWTSYQSFKKFGARVG